VKLVAIVIECRKCGKVNRLVLSDGSRSRPLCGSCRSPLFEFSVVNGFIYVLSNTAIPGLLKIGCTQRAVEDRVKELNAATGVPAPFSVEAYFPAQDPEADERIVHEALAHCRLLDKEFFTIKVADAIEALSTALKRRPLFVTSDAAATSSAAGARP
jgi:hypothetical protein